MKTLATLVKPLATLEALLFPEPCPGCGGLCGGTGSTLLCETCDQAMPRTLKSWSGLPTLRGIEQAWVLGEYAGPLGALVRLAKYRPDLHTCRDLAARLEAATRPVSRLTDVSEVTFVPTSTRRRFVRGFDQAEVLARTIATALGHPCRPMIRRVDPMEQAGRTDRERRAAAAGAFRLGPVTPMARVLLVDDVLTTGASVAACADELLCGGAQQVWVLAATGR